MIRNSWKPFEVQEIFDNIQRGKRLTKDNQIEGTIPYISSTSLNNGVDNFIGNKENVRTSGYDLTIANSGSVGSTFYHPYNYIASDHVHSLSNEKFNKYQYLFLSVLLNRLKDKYHFNREINEKRLKTDKLMLPVNDEGSPDWEYMEIEGKKIYENEITKVKKYLNKRHSLIKNSLKAIEKLEDKNWLPFEIGNISLILSGKDIYEKERIEGDIPYITSGSTNNGIGYFVGNDNNSKEKEGISVNRNGAVGYAFYHPYEALYGNDTRKVIPKHRNKYSSLFLSHMITMQKEKYGYGLKMGTARLKKQKIMLPVTSDNEPDWKFMESYMKQVEYNHLNKLINYLD